MNGIDTLSPEEFVRGLMRGSRPEFHAGYTATNAVLAVAHQRALDDHGRAILTAYAKGFRDGMDALLADRELSQTAPYPAEDHVLVETYHRGQDDGYAENARAIQPTPEP